MILGTLLVILPAKNREKICGDDSPPRWQCPKGGEEDSGIVDSNISKVLYDNGILAFSKEKYLKTLKLHHYDNVTAEFPVFFFIFKSLTRIQENQTASKLCIM